MEISGFRHNNVTECAACGALFSTLVANDPACRALMAAHEAHVDCSPDCKAYFDALPTMEDVLAMYQSETQQSAGEQ